MENFGSESGVVNENPALTFESVERVLTSPGKGFGVGEQSVQNPLAMLEAAMLPNSETRQPVPKVLPSVRELRNSSSPIEAQYQKALETVRNAIRRRASGIPGIGNGESKDSFAEVSDGTRPKGIDYSAPTASPRPRKPTDSVLKSQPVGGAFARSVGLGMAKPYSGGSPVPSYQYDGVTVALPTDVDPNDDVAVKSAVDADREVIDMMNSLYEEEN